MEPTQPSPAPEQPNSRPVEGEKSTPESTPAELASAPSMAAPVTPIQSVAGATPPANPAAAQPATNQAAVPVVTGPAVANDQDVIEKEWVDKADEVVKKTAGNPHAEEEAVEDLQIDYLKKRYNKDVKKSEN